MKQVLSYSNNEPEKQISKPQVIEELQEAITFSFQWIN